MSKRTTQRLAMRETVAVADKLRSVCHSDNDGFAVYEEGWNDERVAKSFEFEVSAHNVNVLRVQLIGKIKSVGNPKPEGKRHVTVEDVKPMVVKLNDLDYFVRALCDYLDVDPVKVMTQYENRRRPTKEQHQDYVAA